MHTNPEKQFTSNNFLAIGRTLALEYTRQAGGPTTRNAAKKNLGKAVWKTTLAVNGFSFEISRFRQIPAFHGARNARAVDYRYPPRLP